MDYSSERSDTRPRISHYGAECPRAHAVRVPAAHCGRENRGSFCGKRDKAGSQDQRAARRVGTCSSFKAKIGIFKINL